MQRPTKPLLPPNYKDSVFIQIGWNGFWRKQCELSPKGKDCAMILSQIYDPVLGRLRPAEISLK
jgi:hypothetical protein